MPNCTCFDEMREPTILETKQDNVSFRHIKRYGYSGMEVSLGYGIYVAREKDIDIAIKFKFCPFCGKEFSIENHKDN